MINKFDALCLLVGDLAKSQNFYENILKLKISSTDTGFVEYRINGIALALFEKKHATAMFPKKYIKPAGGSVIAFKVADVEQAYQELIQLGQKFFETPKKTPWGQEVAYLHDPDGNIIELTSYKES